MSDAPQPTDPVTLHLTYDVGPDDEGVRLDVFLAEQDDPPLSRAQVKRCLDDDQVRVNGQPPKKAGQKLHDGDEIAWDWPLPRPIGLEAQPIPLDFLYIDEKIALVDKPAGMVVHPSPGHPDGTLVNALLHHLDKLSRIGDALRPGIVHRLDKDTSGALVIARDEAAHQHLLAHFKDHSIERVYHAIVLDQGLDDAGTFDTLHGRDPAHRMRFSSTVPRGKRAVTHYKVLERYPSGAALVACRLDTGRTHQIRVHLRDAGCPLLGDVLYGGRHTSSVSLIGRHALHALVLGVPHPTDGRMIRVQSPYPADFAHALEHLRAGHDWR